MDHREPEHEQVPDLPERRRPLAGDEAEVDRGDALAGDEVDEQVPEDQDEQDHAGRAHEHPAVELGVAARGQAGRAGLGGRGRLRVGDGGHHSPPNTCMRWRGRKPAMVTTNRPIDDPEHHALVLRALGPEVHEDDPDAVERVEHDGGDEAGLTESHDRVLVRGDDVVVRLGGDAHERRVEHVHEQEEEDGDAGHAVRDPRPHAFPPSVERSGRHFAGSRRWGRCRHWGPSWRVRGSDDGVLVSSTVVNRVRTQPVGETARCEVLHSCRHGSLGARYPGAHVRLRATTDPRLPRRRPGRRCGHPPVAAVARRPPQVPARPHRHRAARCCRRRSTGCCPLTGAGGVLVVTGTRHADAVAAQLPELAPADVLAEPSPRDSMAAIGLAAAVLLERHGEDVVLGSFAADHVIDGTEAFEQTVREGVVAARAGYVVTIGIAATGPSTAFGYVRSGAPLGLDGAPSVQHVPPGFTEKPDAVTATAYLATGEYRWNAGMFIVRARVLLDHLAAQLPALAAGLQEIAAAWDGPDRAEVLDRVWPGLTKIAIDHAIAEPVAAAGGVAVVPGDFTWDDIGDFDSLAAAPAGRHARRRGPGAADRRRRRVRRAGHRADRRPSSGCPTRWSSTPPTRCW